MRHTKATTTYYSGGGRKRIEQTVLLAVRPARTLAISHLLIFTADGLGPRAAVKQLEGAQSPRVVAVTFPAGQAFFNADQESSTTELASEENRAALESMGIQVVQGTMPFREIVVPGAGNPKIDALLTTLGLLFLGMHLCVQAVLIATDHGAIEQGE